MSPWWLLSLPRVWMKGRVFATPLTARNIRPIPVVRSSGLITGKRGSRYSVNIRYSIYCEDQQMGGVGGLGYLVGIASTTPTSVWLVEPSPPPSTINVATLPSYPYTGQVEVSTWACK
ncbi:hypothetical protein BD779DRAFT_1794994 [Infundibulicybe gibba]|nr:hypothetical protein BD779DRAFT_1794994 [Infundibulicybe gibba]